ncbi:MAG TPA: HD domain-containing protein [Verrucomicrobiae bacterium]|nr:HD domain-containing protein [Verrucomicrobiae bacterium]
MSRLPEKNYFRYKSIRDPLYGFIDLSKKETAIIDSKAFKRLQNIKQLSHAYVVYPSAIHTRFEHSLGALHVADRICEQLDFEKERKEIVRLAMLLHDVGHGPFSHLFEHVLKKINTEKFDHEDISCWIMKENTEISGILGNKIKSIITILKKDDKSLNWESSGNSLNSDIISSGLDADKLDYLRRDSYHIGVAYGQFDLERIILTLKQTPNKTRICIDAKGKDSVENYRLGRYLMHAQVYEHHTRITADQMFLKALDLAITKENILDKKSLKISKSASHKKFLNYYLELDDRSVYDQILEKRNSESAKILQSIKERKLLKRACDFYLGPMTNAEVAEKIVKMDREKTANDIAHDLKIDPNEIIIHLSQITIKLYDKRDILVLWKSQPTDLNDLSPISAESMVQRFLVFGPRNDDKRKKVTKKVADLLGLHVKDLTY